MKKNKVMRFASVVLVMTLLSTCMVGGTFAKYTTEVESQDSARVAKWGFEPSTMVLDNLFLGSYNNVVSNNGDDVIAPGTEGETAFAFAFDGTNGAQGPEVAYTFSVGVESSCSDAILANPNIVWQLDSNGWGSWDEMIADITALSGHASGSMQYALNTLPAAFGEVSDEHTISWQWVFETADDAGASENEKDVQDDLDTLMGNAEELDDCSITITITATQID